MSFRNKDIFLFIKEENCFHCHSFTPIWERLSADSEIKNKYQCKVILCNLSKKIDVPPPFDWIPGFPMIMKITKEDYYKVYNDEDFLINNKIKIKRESYNKERTFISIKKWLLE